MKGLFAGHFLTDKSQRQIRLGERQFADARLFQKVTASFDHGQSPAHVFRFVRADCSES